MEISNTQTQMYVLVWSQMSRRLFYSGIFWGCGGYAYDSITSTKVLEVLEGVRRIERSWKWCTLRTAGVAMCAKVPEVVLKVLKVCTVCRWSVLPVNGRCMAEAGGYALCSRDARGSGGWAWFIESAEGGKRPGGCVLLVKGSEWCSVWL